MSIMRFCLKIIIISLASTSLCSHAMAQEVWQDIERIVAIGDLHGDYEQYLQILTDNNLIDAKKKWRGGKTHLVQLGDVPDRGPDSLKIIRHLQTLQKQARKAKGNVHTLIGNHELMNVKDDLDYVHPGEYKILVNRKSRRAQADYVKRVYLYMLEEDASIKEDKKATMRTLTERFPLGFVEHRLIWGPGGEVFEWVRGNNTVIKINGLLFVHGGISPHQELLPLRQINEEIREIIGRGRLYSTEPIILDEGPLWYRGLAHNNTSKELEPLKKMLAFYDAESIVIAHTPTVGAIVQRFDGRVILIDVGLGAHYGKRRANLVVEDNVRYTMHRGKKIQLPTDADGLLDYLKVVSKLDPIPSPLLATIAKLEAGKMSQPESQIPENQSSRTD